MFIMSQKRIRTQKKPVRRREEVKTEVNVPKKTNSAEIKKKLESSEEVLKKIDELLEEVSAKVKEVSELSQSLCWKPRVPNCEGRMIDLRR